MGRLRGWRGVGYMLLGWTLNVLAVVHYLGWTLPHAAWLHYTGQIPRHPHDTEGRC